MTDSPADRADPSEPRPALRPEVVVFDVNETLSDMSPMAQRFADVGAPQHLAATWFAGLLRDGFALTSAGTCPSFAELGAGLLSVQLANLTLNRELDASVAHIMQGFGTLALHPDVAAGITTLADAGLRLVTLTNGAASVAGGLFERAGIRDRFELLLSVEEAGVWKPAAGSYAYALRQCDVAPSAALLVAVHPWDIDGAHRVGLRTAWLNRTGAPYPDYFERADVEVASLVELASSVRRGRQEER